MAATDDVYTRLFGFSQTSCLRTSLVTDVSSDWLISAQRETCVRQRPRFSFKCLWLCSSSSVRLRTEQFPPRSPLGPRHGAGVVSDKSRNAANSVGGAGRDGELLPRG